jgi:hypothetical protein
VAKITVPTPQARLVPADEVYEILGSDGTTYHYIFVRYQPPGGVFDASYSCTCPGYKYRQTCKHVVALRSLHESK